LVDFSSAFASSITKSSTQPEADLPVADLSTCDRYFGVRLSLSA
jgi:hypothetical protein